MRSSKLTKVRILDAAETVFSNKGFWGARVDEIAEVSGCNKRMIYAYFENKETLYKNVLSRIIERLEKHEENIDVNLPPEIALGKLVLSYFNFFKNNISIINLIMWENLNKAKCFSVSEIDDIEHSFSNLLKTIIHNGQKTGVFKQSIDENEIVFATNSLIVSYFSNYIISAIASISLDNKADLDKRAKFVTDMILSQIMESEERSGA